MNTVVLVFEKEDVLCLKTLREKIDALPFSLRIFPLLVEGKKIAKRWALVENENGKSFVEKEERIPTVEEFIETLKGQVCTIFLNAEEMSDISSYFSLSKSTLELSLYVEGVKINKENILDVYSGIIKAVLIFFNKAEVLLRGIRIKNKTGKKETVETKMYIADAPYKLPTEIDMVQKEAEGVEMKKCISHVENKVLAKILSRSSLCFANLGVYLKLEFRNNQLISTISKEPSKISIIDTAQIYLTEQNNKHFLLSLIKKYGDSMKPIAESLIDKEEKDAKYFLDASNTALSSLSHDAKTHLLEGISEILNTLVFQPSDKRSPILTSLHRMYTEEIKNIKKEGTNSALPILLSPSKPVDTSSLHFLIREKRHTSQVQERIRKNNISPK